MQSFELALWLALLGSALCHSFATAGSETGGPLDDLCSRDSASLSHRTLLLSDSSYQMTSGGVCRVEDVQNLTVIGNADVTTIQCIRHLDNITSAAFSFINVTSLSIENVHFVGCGAALTGDDLKYMMDTSYYYFDIGQAAILLCNHCFNLFLSNVRFSNNTGYSFVGINLHGNSMLNDVQVLGEDDTPYSPDDPRCTRADQEYVCNDRGMLLFFTDSTLSPPPANAQLVVNNSIFSSNTLPWSNISSNSSQVRCVWNTFENFISPWDLQTRHTLPDVGALMILYMQESFVANVTVLSTTFADNRGLCLGAVFILMHTTSASLTHQQIQNCTFLRNLPLAVPKNEAKNYFGCDVTAYMQYKGPYMEEECISITDSYLTGLNTTENPSISMVHFPDTYGKCKIYLRDLSTNTSTKFLFVSGLLRGDTIDLTIKDMRMMAKKNSRYSLKGLDLNNGLLMFVSVGNVTINGTGLEKCQFSNLLGPVIVIRSSVLTLAGTMLFANIHASTWAYGAAIHIQSGSNVWLLEPLHAEFCNNSAVAGGAIASVQLVAEFCIIQYQTLYEYSEQNITDMKIRLVFSGNTAQVAGNSIYVEGLYSCSIRLSPLVGQVLVQKIYDTVFEFNQTVNNELLEVSSTPKEICLCEGDPTNVSRSALNCALDSLVGVAEITTYPGKAFTLSLISVDEAIQPVYSSMYNRLLPRNGEDSGDYYYTDDFKWRLGFGLDIVKVYGYNCSQVNFSIFIEASEYASEYSKGILTMYPYGQVDCLAIPVVLKKCPYGYKLDEGMCDCGNLLSRRDFRCDINTGITRPQGGIWVGVVSNDTDASAEGNWSSESAAAIGYSTSCPTLYCTDRLEVDLDDSRTVCNFNRVGILCGQCAEGLSTVIGFPKCKKCSNLWLLTIPLYALAGVALVCLLFLLRLTVASGTINGLIFFANIYSTHHVMDFDSTAWLSVFISLLNLDMGVSVCLYDGLNSLTATYMSFVVPVYLWLIVLIIILLSRRFQAVAKLTARSAVPVLATIIHLSFSKLLSFVVSGLSGIDLEIEDENGSISHRFVWYFDGSVEYYSKYHIGLFCLSMISLLFFLLPYTIFLTGIKWFARFRFTDRIRPFVDAFCAPYKDKWRFWFGARLWVLIIFYIWSFCLRSYTHTLLLIKTITMVLFVVTQVAIMPYKNVLVNYLDIFFLVDLLLLYITSLYGKHFEVTTNVFLVPVFLVFCLIIAYHVYLVTGKSKRVRKMFLKMHKSADIYDDLDSSVLSSPEDNREDGVSERSSLSTPKGGSATYSTLAVNVNDRHDVYHYKPGELREPLIETDSESNS